MVPRLTCMERSLTTTRPSNDLGQAVHVDDDVGVGFGCGAHRDAPVAGLRGRRCQRNVDRLTDAQCAGLFRQRLDQEDELCALLQAVDHRRREFGALAMKLTRAVSPFAQPSQAILTRSP